MLEVKLYRTRTCDEGTRGLILVDGSRCWCALELPWRDNKRNLSCIPPGKYRAVIVPTVHHGKAYELQGVPDRDNILIHPGNWAGDVEKGWRTDSQGCILIGSEIKLDKAGQLMLCNSKLSYKDFMAYTQKDDLDIEIKWI